MKRKPTEGLCCFCNTMVYTDKKSYNKLVTYADIDDSAYTDTKRHNRIFFHKSCYYDNIQRSNIRPEAGD